MIRGHRADKMVAILRPEFMNGGGGGVGPFPVAGADIDITGLTVSRAGNKILRFDTGGTILSEYANTGAGLDLASAAAAAGDVIWVPEGTITGDHTLTDDVQYVGHSQMKTIFTGQLTVGDGTILENCSIIRSLNDATQAKGVYIPSGSPYLCHLQIQVDQAGAGDAAGIWIECTELFASECFVIGEADAGFGYALFAACGDAYLYGGYYKGNVSHQPFYTM